MDYARAPDEELLRRFRGGDTAAFEELLDRYSRAIYNFALRMLNNHDDAEDASQQTFIQAFESLPGTRPEVPIPPWLLQVARTKCIDLIRRRRSVPLSTMPRNDEEDAVEIDPPGVRPRPEEIY